MKKLLLILSIITLASSCQKEVKTIPPVVTEVKLPPKHIQYKYVINTIQTSETKQVTHYETQDNRVSHTAGGALVGGLAGHFLGFGWKKGAVGGGLIGAAASSSPTTTSWVENVTTYHCITYFNDSSTTRSDGTCPYIIGDSIPIN